jgi:hypothetical protein
MSAPVGTHERVYRWLIRAYPAAFRQRFGDEMVQLFGDELRFGRGRPRGIILALWYRTLVDLAVTSVSERAAAHRALPPPPRAIRALGLFGVVGGVLLAAAFVPALPWTQELFNLRLVVFNLGAIAIAIAVHRRQAPKARTLSIVGTLPVVVANGSYLGLLLLEWTQPNPYGGFGIEFVYAGTALWAADAWFGLVAARLGTVTRWGALAVAVGAGLTSLGMGNLGLVDGPYGAFFGPAALFGIGLLGIGWILLGIDIAFRRVPAHPNALSVAPAPGSAER